MNVVFCLLIFFSQFTLAQHKSRETIKNPYLYIWEDEGSVQGITRFFLDINDDQEPELFVGADSLIGNGGGEFHIFQHAKGTYNYLGVVFHSPGNLNVTANKSYGFNDLRACTHISARQCNLQTHKFNGERYELKSKRLIDKSDLPSDFKPPKVAVEKSGKTLGWQP